MILRDAILVAMSEIGANEIRTSAGREPKLYGWCGTTDDVPLHALGVVVVERLSASGQRALVRELDDLGWPSLAPVPEVQP